jgi:hypothetical protein
LGQTDRRLWNGRLLDEGGQSQEGWPGHLECKGPPPQRQRQAWCYPAPQARHHPGAPQPSTARHLCQKVARTRQQEGGSVGGSGTPDHALTLGTDLTLPDLFTEDSETPTLPLQHQKSGRPPSTHAQVLGITHCADPRGPQLLFQKTHCPNDQPQLSIWYTC